MHFDWWTLGLQTINFAVLVWLLHRLLYRPVLRIIDARRREMETQFADAAAAAANAKAQLAAVEAERSGIDAEREAALKAAIAQADEVVKTRRAQAERDLAALMKEARKTLAEERREALAEAQTLAVDLGAEVAQRILSETPESARSEGWLERIERHLASLSETEREALTRRLDGDAALTVVTASSLAPEAVEKWRLRLGRALGAETPMTFIVDPALIAGADLHFPGAILRFSWQSVLAAARAELNAS